MITLSFADRAGCCLISAIWWKPSVSVMTSRLVAVFCFIFSQSGDRPNIVALAQ